MAHLTDNQIESYVKSRKVLPKDASFRLKSKSNLQHKEREVEVSDTAGNVYKIVLRKHRYRPQNFTCILSFYARELGRWVRLVRFNGKHEHTNGIEADRFLDFHIHRATQRYMEAGLKEDSYARVTRAYSTFDGALTAFMDEINCHSPNGAPVLPFGEKHEHSGD